MIDQTELNRLRWRCRRGMLELDIILLNFLDKGYAQLNPTERQVFVRLLETQDQTLLAWFRRDETPDDAALQDMIKKIY